MSEDINFDTVKEKWRIENQLSMGEWRIIRYCILEHLNHIDGSHEGAIKLGDNIVEIAGKIAPLTEEPLDRERSKK